MSTALIILESVVRAHPQAPFKFKTLCNRHRAALFSLKMRGQVRKVMIRLPKPAAPRASGSSLRQTGVSLTPAALASLFSCHLVHPGTVPLLSRRRHTCQQTCSPPSHRSYITYHEILPRSCVVTCTNCTVASQGCIFCGVVSESRLPIECKLTCVRIATAPAASFSYLPNSR